jgi:hypothetical protein
LFVCASPGLEPGIVPRNHALLVAHQTAARDKRGMTVDQADLAAL